MVQEHTQITGFCLVEESAMFLVYMMIALCFCFCELGLSFCAVRSR